MQDACNQTLTEVVNFKGTKVYKNAKLVDIDSRDCAGGGGHHSDEIFRRLYSTITFGAAGGVLSLLAQQR